MNLRIVPAILFASFSVFVVTACTSSVAADDDDDSSSNSSGGKTDAGPAVDEDDPANQPPHSLGVITLGEAHASTNRNTVSPIVSAAFFPDAKLSASCGQQEIAGCQVLSVPKCEDAKGESTCESGEYCTWNDSCTATCQLAPQCDEACEEDEVCKLKSTKAGDAEGVCTKRDSFDAGPLAFDGTTTSITMFPPYSYESTSTGAPFLAGAKLHVQAQGANGAGFEAFDEDFTATRFIQTTGKISRSQAFGTDDVPVEWVAGDDDIMISVAGVGGSATCKASDSAGSFSVPRKVLDAVLESGLDTNGASTLSLSVTRVRTETKKDKKASGDSVNGTAVIADGWLQLVTSSSESTSLSGCSAPLLACSDTGTDCVDPKTDAENCGGCGKVCDSGKVCSAGKCASDGSSCQTCSEQAQAGACSTVTNACTSKDACVTLYNCVAACNDQTCANQCATANPDGVAQYNAMMSCLQNECGSVCE